MPSLLSARGTSLQNESGQHGPCLLPFLSNLLLMKDSLQPGQPLDPTSTSEAENLKLRDGFKARNGIANSYGPDSRTFLADSDDYIPIDSHENRHRWDIDFQWTEDEEKRLVKRVGTFERCLDEVAAYPNPRSICGYVPGSV